MLKYFTTFLLLLGFCTITFAQSKKLEKAKTNYDNQNYILAIEQLEKLLEEDANAYEPLKYIANCYRKIHNYDRAEYYYNQVVSLPNAQADDYLYYGQTLKKNGKLAAAKEQFVKFSQKGNAFLGNLMVQSFNEVDEWEKLTKDTRVESDNRFNTELSENNFQVFQDKYYITSNRDKDYVSPEAFGWDGTPYFSIYELDTALLGAEKEKFSTVSGKLNTTYNDGPLTISKDEKKVIITRVVELLGGKDFSNTMKLYEGEFVKGKWKSFKALPFNSNDYSHGHATYGENDNVIYFTSNQPGGFGGYDIYKSIKENGKWQDPVNLGPSINTTSNELFPYFFKSKLYYSSDGFSGYGGLDILVSEFNKEWQSPTNLKSPINSTRDDFGIYFTSDSTGYLASDRKGGLGKDDIYKFYKSSTPLSVGVTGVFEYKGLPVEGTKIVLVDSKDSIIAVQYTDEKGRFAFRKLAYQEDVFFKVETEDPALAEDGRLFVTNKAGEKIKLIERLKNGSFKFKALPAEEIELELLAAEDEGLIETTRFAGRIFTKLPGDFQEEVKVYLVNDQGQIVDSVFTDASGTFEFKKLGLDNDGQYFVKMAEDSMDLNVAFLNEEGRFLQVEKAEDGKYKLIRDKVGRGANNGLTAVVARLEGSGKSLPFTRVDIYDEANNLVATVFTNEKGEFQYNKLSLDKNYSFKLPDLADEDILNTKLYVLDDIGDPLYLINRLKDGKFSYTALPLDEYQELQLMEEALVPELVELKGQIYKKLQGDYDEELKVYLVDENGLVIDSVYTDLEGKFNFEKLDPDRSYSFKVEEDKDLNLALLDEEDRILEEAIINENGNFTYKKLTYQVASFEPLEAVDEDLIEDQYTHEIFGQVYQKLPGDFDKGMEVYVYDQDGRLVGTALTDDQGKFKFTKLNPDNTYYFRIEHSEEDFQLLTLDEEENIIDKTIKNRLGFFRYKQLSLDHHKISLVEEQDHHQILFLDNKKIDLDTFTVHYRFDSTKLNTRAKISLQEFLRIVKGNEFIVEVQSYTDNRGPSWYNEKLSKQRTNEVVRYLLQNGISKGNIVGLYFGELDPIVDCRTKDCDNEDHARNRRTELKLRIVNKDSKQ